MHRPLRQAWKPIARAVAWLVAVASLLIVAIAGWHVALVLVAAGRGGRGATWAFGATSYVITAAVMVLVVATLALLRKRKRARSQIDGAGR